MKNWQIFYQQELGVNVLPIKPYSKEPAVNWKTYQSEFFEGEVNPEQNIAVLCGSISNNLVVLDYDFPEAYDMFELESLLDKTIVVQTGSGKYHVYVRPFPPIQRTLRLTNDNGQHIDIQFNGTYVVAPPSIHPGTLKPYKILGKARQIQKVDFNGILKVLQDHGFETDQATTLRPIKEIITKGVSKGERHPSAFKLSCFLIHDKGLDYSTAWYELQQWNNNLCIPQLPEKDLRYALNCVPRYSNPEKYHKHKKVLCECGKIVTIKDVGEHMKAFHPACDGVKIEK